jgi:hypothetical protein
MSHKHPCPDCGEEKWCDIEDCIFDPSDESRCDDCSDIRADAERKRREKAARAAEGGEDEPNK